MWVYLRVSVLSHWSVWLFLCQYHTVLIIVALCYRLEAGSVILPVLFFLRIAWAIQGLLWLHTDFRIVFPLSMKNGIGILVGIALNVYWWLWGIWMFKQYFSGSWTHFMCLPICLCLPQFPSSKSFSFQWTDLLPPWLNWFLGIYWFVTIVNGIFFSSFQIFCS